MLPYRHVSVAFEAAAAQRRRRVFLLLVAAGVCLGTGVALLVLSRGDSPGASRATGGRAARIAPPPARAAWQEGTPWAREKRRAQAQAAGGWLPPGEESRPGSVSELAEAVHRVELLSADVQAAALSVLLLVPGGGSVVGGALLSGLKASGGLLGGETSSDTSSAEAEPTAEGVVESLAAVGSRAAGGAVPPSHPPLPPAPPSRLLAYLAESGTTLPEKWRRLDRGRPEGAARPGSCRLPWPSLPADAEKRDEVVAAMREAWGAYAASAMGFDELSPAARRGKNGFGGLGATVVDSLDTLWMMGLSDEFAAARAWVAAAPPFSSKSYDASVFETTIRVVGGLLSAHHLTGDELFSRRAEELAAILLPAFDSPSGIPYTMVNLKTGRARNAAWAHSASALAEFGSTQLEFLALSEAVGNATYGEKSEAVIRALLGAGNRMRGASSGLWPLWLDPRSNAFTGHKVSFGAMGDSFYEYLLKAWLAGGQTPALSLYRSLWEEAMESLVAVLLRRSTPAGYSYIGELDRGLLVHKMDHLACFVPGMLALGAAGDLAERHLALAADLAETCVAMYSSQPTGLAPELVHFKAGADMAPPERGAHNLLRPEALESLFYLWRRTGEARWREAGWAIFQAFQKHCRLPDGRGYAGLRDVRVLPPVRDDTQQSFFLAETLKYAFLLFSDSEALDLDAWVLNTEAHPLRVGRREASLLEEEEVGEQAPAPDV